MKLRPSKKDTIGKDRKVALIDVLSITSSYNLAAEHFRWDVINFSGRTQLFKAVDITFNGTLDPYAYDTSLKRRIEKFEYNVSGKLARFTSAMVSVSANIRSMKKAKTKYEKSTVIYPNIYHDELDYILAHPDYYVDFNIPWDLSLYYNIVYTKPAMNDTIIQSFTFSGDMLVTPKWKLGFHSGFDFVKKDFTYTSLDIYRDLHCWEMRLNWIPFSFRKSYMLTIGVKSSVLQDLRLMRKRDWYDYN
jgi:hypothetical protein